VLKVFSEELERYYRKSGKNATKQDLPASLKEQEKIILLKNMCLYCKGG